MRGKYTFTGGRGNTVIDYIIGDIGVKDRIKRMTVENRVDSDHHLVEVWLEEEVKGKRNGGKAENVGEGSGIKKVRIILGRKCAGWK